MPVVASLQLGELEVAFSASPTRTKRVLQTRYGDGYMERRADGIQPWKTVWQMESVPLEEDRWLELEFQLELLGEKPFYWQAPGSPEPTAWAINPVKWQRNYNESLATVRFTIETWNGPTPGPIVVPPPILLSIEPDYIVRTAQDRVYPASGVMYPTPYSDDYYPAKIDSPATVQITGRNFIPGAQVLVGGYVRPAQYINPYILLLSDDAAGLTPGPKPVVVRINGVDSNALTLEVR